MVQRVDATSVTLRGRTDADDALGGKQMGRFGIQREGWFERSVASQFEFRILCSEAWRLASWSALGLLGEHQSRLSGCGRIAKWSELTGLQSRSCALIGVTMTSLQISWISCYFLRKPKLNQLMKSTENLINSLKWTVTVLSNENGPNRLTSMPTLQQAVFCSRGFTLGLIGSGAAGPLIAFDVFEVIISSSSFHEFSLTMFTTSMMYLPGEENSN